MRGMQHGDCEHSDPVPDDLPPDLPARWFGVFCPKRYTHPSHLSLWILLRPAISSSAPSVKRPKFLQDRFNLSRTSLFSRLAVSAEQYSELWTAHTASLEGNAHEELSITEESLSE